MNYFLEMFGDISVGQVATFIAALVFLGGILKAVWAFVSNKITKSNEKAAEWKKIAEQVQQYPMWREQSIEIRDELAKSIQALSNKVDETNKTLDAMQLRSKRNYATTCRYRIIRFNDELLQKGEHEILHTKEHFDQILEDIDEYEDYCNLDRDYKNSKAVMAIEHIRQVYQKCADEGTFL